MDVDTLYIVGLALDHSVFHSAKDAKSLGYTTIVVQDATRGNDTEKNSEALRQMKQMNISIIQSTEDDPNNPILIPNLNPKKSSSTTTSITATTFTTTLNNIEGTVLINSITWCKV